MQQAWIRDTGTSFALLSAGVADSTSAVHRGIHFGVCRVLVVWPVHRHMHKNSPDEAAHIRHLPLRQARPGLSRKCFTFVCVCLMSAAILPKQFFLWKKMM